VNPDLKAIKELLEQILFNLRLIAGAIVIALFAIGLSR
jgi:hypothetical protein